MTEIWYSPWLKRWVVMSKTADGKLRNYKLYHTQCAATARFLFLVKLYSSGRTPARGLIVDEMRDLNETWRALHPKIVEAWAHAQIMTVVPKWAEDAPSALTYDTTRYVKD